VINEPIKKNDVSNYGINLEKIIQQSSHNNSSQVFLLGDDPIKMEQCFAGFEGVFIGSDYGKPKCYGFVLWE
jgi:hypothetical protein